MANKKISKITAPDSSGTVRTYDLGSSDGLRFVGMVKAVPTGTTYTLVGETTPINASVGDLVMYGTGEYVYRGNSVWAYVGDENLHITGLDKTTRKIIPSVSSSSGTYYTGFGGSSDDVVTSVSKDTTTLISGISYDTESVFNSIDKTGVTSVGTKVNSGATAAAISVSLTGATTVSTGFTNSSSDFVRSAGEQHAHMPFTSFSLPDNQKVTAYTRSTIPADAKVTLCGGINVSGDYVSGASMDEATETLTFSNISAVTGITGKDYGTGVKNIGVSTNGSRWTGPYYTMNSDPISGFSNTTAKAITSSALKKDKTSYTGVTYGIDNFVNSATLSKNNAFNGVTYGTIDVIANPSLDATVTAITSITPNTGKRLVSAALSGKATNGITKVTPGAGVDVIRSVAAVRSSAKADPIIFPSASTYTYDKNGSATISATILKPQGTNSYVRTHQMVDLTGYTRLLFTCSDVGTSANWQKNVGVSKNRTIGNKTTYTKVLDAINGTVVIDITELSGEYYIGGSVYTTSGQAGGFNITSITLE